LNSQGTRTTSTKENIATERRQGSSISILKSDYLSVQPIIQWLSTVALQKAHGTMLDLGCGNKPYAALFAPAIAKYIGADIAQNAAEDVELLIPATGKLPIPDASIDTVLSTQVLEHVPEPQEYLEEVGRVLRPHGTFILTCPMAFMLHEEPYDFYRYTEHGIRYMLNKFNMDVISIETAGGAWRLMGQIFLNHKGFGRKSTIPIVTAVFHYFWIVTVNISCLLLDNYNTNRKDTANYLVIARKRANA
jgi:SAM-dependent methyltransferase